jgi:hypothetical protein
MHTVLPYFLYASRNQVVKSGAGPYVYTTTPLHVGDVSDLPTAGKKSLSITVMKAGQVFGFVGCVVSQMSFTVEEGIPTMTFSIVGSAEDSESTPTPTFVTADLPFNAGQYNIQVPVSTQVLDVESFSFTVNDNAEPQFRLSENSGAQWVKFGEREVTCEMSRDFSSRAELELFKTITATSVLITLTSGANIVTLRESNAVREVYEIDGASDQGSPIMASVTYHGAYDSVTSKAYEITVTTTENIA